MDKLKTSTNGGFPLTLDDVRHLQNSIRDAILGLSAPYGTTIAGSYILSGCEYVVEPSPSTVDTIKDGWIVLGGEICKVNEHTVSKFIPGTKRLWVVEESNDANGLKVLENGTTYNSHAIRTANVIITYSTPAEYIELNNVPTIHKLIADNTSNHIGKWDSVLLLNDDVEAYDDVTLSSFSVEHISVADAKVLKYRKVNKTVTIDISINGANTGLAQVSKFFIKLPNNWTVSKNYTGSGRFLNVTRGVEPVGTTRATALNVRAGSLESINVPKDVLVIEPVRNTYEKFSTGGGSNNVIIEASITVEID